MPPRSFYRVLTCLLAAAAVSPAAAGDRGSASLRVGVRIVADCTRPRPGDPAGCRPARQRSDGSQTVPAQVATLSPPAETAAAGQPPQVTVTY